MKNSKYKQWLTNLTPDSAEGTIRLADQNHKWHGVSFSKTKQYLKIDGMKVETIDNTNVDVFVAVVNNMTFIINFRDNIPKLITLSSQNSTTHINPTL